MRCHYASLNYTLNMTLQVSAGFPKASEFPSVPKLIKCHFAEYPDSLVLSSAVFQKLISNRLFTGFS